MQPPRTKVCPAFASAPSPGEGRGAEENKIKVESRDTVIYFKMILAHNMPASMLFETYFCIDTPPRFSKKKQAKLINTNILVINFTPKLNPQIQKTPSNEK